MTRIKSCCYCINLRTGGLIIGIFSCTGAMFYFFRYLIELVRTEERLMHSSASGLEKEFIKIIIYVLIVTQPIRFAAGVGLMVGVLKRKSMLLSVWLSVQMLGVFRIIRAVFIFVSSEHISTKSEQTDDLIEILVGLFLTIWFWIIIYSLFCYTRFGEQHDHWDPTVFPNPEFHETPEMSVTSYEGLDQRRRTIVSITSAVEREM